MSRIYEIVTNEDGESKITIFDSKEAYLKSLNEHLKYSDEPPIFADNYAAGELDLICLKDRLVILGEQIQPRPKKVVEEFDI